MANTTYFGWETPDDTDLVKDGAAAIRTLGQAIDTSMQDLEGGTTGQILAKNSNTDMDFVWVTNDVGDITEVVAGTGLSGGGSSGSVTLTNTVATEFDAKGDLVVGTGADTFDKLSAGTNDHRLVAASGETTGLKYVADTQNTVIDAAGDLVYGTAADTLGRLAIGTAGQILKVNSGATAPEWGSAAAAGGLTLLSTTTLSSTTTTISTISGDYTNLLVVAKNIVTSTEDSFRIRFNSDTGTNYRFTLVDLNATSVTGNAASGSSLVPVATTDDTNFGNKGGVVMNIYRYTDTSLIDFDINGTGYDGTNKTGRTIWGRYNATAAITSITFLTDGATFTTGTVYIYGVK
jgi:hypothetical protein